MQIKTKMSVVIQLITKPVKQEVNGTVILPHLVFPVPTFKGETCPDETPYGIRQLG